MHECNHDNNGLQNNFHSVFHVVEVLAEVTAERIFPMINGESAKLSIPREVLKGAKSGARVRMASFLFRNMSGFLPERLSVENDT